MKTTYKLLAIVFLFLALQSCKIENTPEQYFDQTTLNTNKLMGFGTKNFEQMIGLKKANMLRVVDGKDFRIAKNYQEYIEKYMIYDINSDIEKIKKLTPTDETKPMIDLSLELFEFVKQKYETDYIKIAKMLDANAQQGEIDAAILKTENESFPTIDVSFKKLEAVALPYAKKHGIEVTRF